MPAQLAPPEVDLPPPGRVPILKRRSLGIAIVAAIYATQFIVLNSIDVPLRQRFSTPLAILGVGWLSSGLVLGNMVLKRRLKGGHYANGLVGALFLSFLLIVGIFVYVINLPRTYSGP